MNELDGHPYVIVLYVWLVAQPNERNKPNEPTNRLR